MEVSELILNNKKWKFDGKFPEHYKAAYGKTRKMLLSTQLWNFNNKISIETSIKKDKTKEIPKKELKERIPEGLYLIKTGSRKDTLAKVYDSLSTLFDNDDKHLLKTNMGNNVFTMFRDPKKDSLLNILVCLEIIQEYDEYLAGY